MPDPVVIEFILRGIPDVMRAMRTVEQAAMASEAATTEAAVRGKNRRVRIATEESEERIRARKSLSDRDARITQEETSSRMKSRKDLADHDARQAEREKATARDLAAAQEKRERERIDTQISLWKLEDRIQRQLNAAKNARDAASEARHTAIAQRLSDKRVRIAQEEARKVAAFRQQRENEWGTGQQTLMRSRSLAQMAQEGAAAKRATEWNDYHNKMMRDRALMQQRPVPGAVLPTTGLTDQQLGRRMFATAVAGAAVRGVIAGGQSVARHARTELEMVGQLGSGFSVSSGVARVAHNAGLTADLLNAGINPTHLNLANRTRRNRAEVEGVLDATTMTYGLKRENTIRGLRQFTSVSGDLDTGLRLMPRLGELTRATGGDIEHITAAAGQTALAFDKEKDGAVKADKIMQVLRIVGGQGRANAVELPHMAVQMGKFVAAANKFQGDNVENLATMTMLSEYAAGGGGAWNASSAATGVVRFSEVFGKAARVKAFKEAGVEVFADKQHSKVRDAAEIVADAFAASKGDQMKVNAMFGGTFAMRSINKFAGFYNDGFEDSTGVRHKGRAAVIAAANEVKKQVLTEGDVTEQAGFRMKELDAQMAVQSEQFDKAIREKIIPALIKLAPEFANLAQMLVDMNAKALPAFTRLIISVAEFADRHKDLVDFLASNPVPTLMAAALGSSLIPTVVSEALRMAILRATITSAVAGATGGATGGTGAGGVLAGTRVGGAAALGVLGGLAVGEVLGSAMLKYESGTDKAETVAAKLQAWNRGARSDGKFTVLDPDEAKKIRDEAQNRLNKDSILEQAFNVVASPFSSSAEKSYARYKEDQAIVNNDHLVKALADATKAIQANTAKVSEDRMTIDLSGVLGVAPTGPITGSRRP